MLEGQEGERPDAVRLSTLHAAKGLEFPHVFLVGLEEGILPHREAVARGDVDEERRLMYVGITRAQPALQLSWCRTRKRAGEWHGGEPSRFIGELAQEDLRYAGMPLEGGRRGTRERGRSGAAQEHARAARALSAVGRSARRLHGSYFVGAITWAADRASTLQRLSKLLLGSNDGVKRTELRRRSVKEPTSQPQPCSRRPPSDRRRRAGFPRAGAWRPCR